MFDNDGYNAFGLQSGELFNSPHFTVYPEKGVHFEGHKGILSFKKECVTVKVKGGKVEVTGENFRIDEISSTDFFLSGKVKSVAVSTGKNV